MGFRSFLEMLEGFRGVPWIFMRIQEYFSGSRRVSEAFHGVTVTSQRVSEGFRSVTGVFQNVHGHSMRFHRRVCKGVPGAFRDFKCVLGVFREVPWAFRGISGRSRVVRRFRRRFRSVPRGFRSVSGCSMESQGFSWTLHGDAKAFQ